MVKLAEILFGGMLIIGGLCDIGGAELFHYDFPIMFPKFFSSASIVAGVLVIAAPWFIRSRKKTDNE
ncbi:MAG: hypothetical protein JEY79_02425 [Pseudodesulfovibrio sp.]|nr:hypothetical protein [Pseudodesulfovibrio sp.]